MARKLTTKQLKYMNNRIKAMGVSESYRDAYAIKTMSDKAISVAANRLEKDARISLGIESGKEAALNASILTREEALQILTTSARVKITDVFDFTFEPVVFDGVETLRTVWIIKATKDIEPAVAACIKSISFDSNGMPKIETYDTHAAIKQLSTMQGWDAPKKTAITDAEGKSVPLSINVNAPEVAQALQALMEKL